ncbi:metallophosphoesterase [Thermodesulfobacteriota bacterium]
MEPRPSSFLYGKEMVGKVTATTATVQLVAGDLCESSAKFRLYYDTISRTDPVDYANQTDELNGFSQDDPIVFSLPRLSPNTRYYYRLGYDTGDGWTYRDEYHFHTQRPPGETFRFSIVTDLHILPIDLTDGNREIVLQNILGSGGDILISLGDDYALAYQQEDPYFWKNRDVLVEYWGRLRAIWDIACHSMSYIPVNGNHEGLWGWTTSTPQYAYILEGKHRYLPVPDGGTFPEGGDADGRYGAFTWGDALFIWLDVTGFCEFDPFLVGDNSLYILGDAQRNFLETTLANSSATWKFIFAHHPFGGDDGWERGYGRGNANDAFQYDQATVQALMEQYGAQAFFYGHDHVFSISLANGVSYICSGKGGSICNWIHRALEHYNPFEIFVNGIPSLAPSGHVQVDVSPTAATVSFIKASKDMENGSVLATHVISP